MIIVGLTSYPTESANEVGKRFLEFPSYTQRLYALQKTNRR